MADRRVTRRKSPPYPMIGLKKALMYCERLKGRYQGQPFTEVRRQHGGDLAELLGYSRTSSRINCILAALRHYGLLVQRGAGPDTPTLSLSPLALEVLSETPGSGRWLDLTRELARRPPAFGQLAQIVGEDVAGQCSKQIRETLQRQGFTVEGAALCLGAYTETLAFLRENGERAPSSSPTGREDGSALSLRGGALPFLAEPAGCGAGEFNWHGEPLASFLLPQLAGQPGHTLIQTGLTPTCACRVLAGGRVTRRALALLEELLARSRATYPPQRGLLGRKRLGANRTPRSGLLFHLDLDCPCYVLFYGSASAEAIDALIAHLQLARTCYPAD
jgi:hypothetical protein